MAGPIVTPLTALLNIQHPIILSGMAGVSGGHLAASVSHAGGLGVLGGMGCTAPLLGKLVSELKSYLTEPSLPFGISLAFQQHASPEADQVNNELVDLVIQAHPRVLVSALGTPSKEIVDRLHGAGILVMNLVGHPKHAAKALDVGVDILCSQGYESRGHTCEIAGPVLLQAIVNLVRKRALADPSHRPIHVVASGGFVTGRALAAALMHGAGAVMMSTRFAASVEADGGDEMKRAILSCSLTDTERTAIYTGRMLRVKSSDYSKSWRTRTADIEEMCQEGIVPARKDVEKGLKVEIPVLMGQSAGLIEDIKTVDAIVRDVIVEAVGTLRLGGSYLKERSKL